LPGFDGKRWELIIIMGVWEAKVRYFLPPVQNGPENAFLVEFAGWFEPK